ncbi:MAG: aminotransferase class I/II-fold pyridoxal phosphate-dependent enzyme, partial [Pirellulales bacterium]
ELGAAIPSVADVYEKAIVLNGLSKTFGLPGLRAGWLVIRDGKVREELIGWKHYTTICPAAPTEYLAMQALSVRDQLAERSRQTVRSNFAKCKSFMDHQAALFRWRPPIAGSTALVEIDLEHLGRKQELAFTTTTEYCHDLAQSHGILLLPGECLGCSDRFVRIGLGRAGFQQALVAWEATLPAIPTSRETQGIST